MYNSIKDDTKILRLTPEKRWYYVALLALSSEQKDRGSLPPVEEIALSLRVREATARKLVREFVDAGLIDEDPATKRLAVHGWAGRQRKSDDVAARVEKHRKRDRNVTEARPVTLPHARATDTDTEADTENTPLCPPHPGGRHAHVTVVDSGEPEPAPPVGVAPPGSPEYRAVMAAIPDGWKLAAEQTAINLLSRLPARAVLFGLQESLERFEGGFGRKVAGYWRAVAEDNPGGRPVRATTTRERVAPAPPPPKFYRAAPDEIIPMPSEAERRQERPSPARGAASGA